MLANEIERSGGTHHEILGMHLVRNENSGKKRAKSGGIIQKGVPHERNPCATVYEEQTPEETLRQANSDSTVAWNGRDKCTMMSKRDISSDWRGYLEKVQRSCDSTDREWESTNKRGRTSFCSWFRSVRDSDDDSMKRQRFFKGGSVASYTLLKTRIFIRAEKVKLHNCGNNWKSITCTIDNFVLLVILGLSSVPAVPAACGKPMLTDSDKQATGNREPAKDNSPSQLI